MASSRGRVGGRDRAVAVRLGERRVRPADESTRRREVEPTAVPPGTSLPPLPPTPTPNPSATPSPTPSPTPPGADPLLGTDGRLTVLLLGIRLPAGPSRQPDRRDHGRVGRSVDRHGRRPSASPATRPASRCPAAAGSTRRSTRSTSTSSRPAGTAGTAMEAAISKAFGIEVDGYVFIGFSGVKNLVDAVGGVDVVLDQAYYDPYYWVTNRHQGWGLPAGKQPPQRRPGADLRPVAQGRQRLRTGAPPADPRRGRAGQGPHARARRSCRSCSGSPGTPSGPTCRWPGRPILFDLVATVDIKRADKVVFGPRSYADGIAGTSSFVAAGWPTVGAWIAQHFPPVRPFGSLAGDALADADGPRDRDAGSLTSISAARRSPARRARSRSARRPAGPRWWARRRAARRRRAPRGPPGRRPRAAWVRATNRISRAPATRSTAFDRRAETSAPSRSARIPRSTNRTQAGGPEVRPRLPDQARARRSRRCPGRPRRPSGRSSSRGSGCPRDRRAARGGAARSARGSTAPRPG